jgi:hypothetical protein
MELKEKSLKSGKLLRDFSLGPHVFSILEDLFSNTPLLHHSVPNKIPAEPFSLTRPEDRAFGPK